MATSRQEKTYNKMIEYYDYADKLVQEAESSKNELSQEQFDIVEKAVETIEDCADQLTSKYIDYVKSNNELDISQDVKILIEEILKKVDKCKSDIIKLHNENK